MLRYTLTLNTNQTHINQTHLRRTQSYTTVLRIKRVKKKKKKKKRSSSQYTDTVTEPLHHEDVFNIHEQMVGNLGDLHTALLGLDTRTEETNTLTNTQTNTQTFEYGSRSSEDEETGAQDEETGAQDARSPDEAIASRRLSRTVWYIP